MKVILHPTDFSDNARPAFHAAAKIAGLSSAKLIVAHVLDIPTLIEHPYVTSYHKLVEREISRTEKEMAKWAERLLSEGSTIEIECVALNNPFITHAINALAIDKNADLVVVGTRGSSKIKEIFLGSTALELVQELLYPVLAIPPAGLTHSPFGIAYAADFHPKDVAALKQLKEIAVLFDAGIDVIHVPDVSQSIRDFPQDFISITAKEVDYAKMRFVTLEAGNVYQRLLEYVEENNIGILGMLEKGRGVFSRLIKQNRVMQVENKSSVPILSFNAKYLM